MLTEDLLQLAKAYKDKSIEDVKKIYNYIERQSKEDKETIISILKENKFNSLIVDIFLDNTESVQAKKELAYHVSAFDHPGIEKEFFLSKLVYDGDLNIINKTQLLLILKNEENFEIAMQLYNHDYFSTVSCVDMELFKKAIEIYKKIITSSPGVFYNNLKISSFYKNVALSCIENVFDQAIDTYGKLNQNQIHKIDTFLCDETIRKFRSVNEIKEMGTVYINSHLNDSVFQLLTQTELLNKESEDHLEIINLYRRANYNEDLLNLIFATKCCLKQVVAPSYIDLLNEVIASNYNKDTISIFKSQVKQIDWEKGCTDLNWCNQTKSLLANSYQGEFEKQMNGMQDVDSFIEYLSQIEEENGNCDLKPNTMVKKFNEVKPQRED